ncbi:MAG: hypothetical protein ACP5KY_08400, partial [Thermoproteus sp.]
QVRGDPQLPRAEQRSSSRFSPPHHMVFYAVSVGVPMRYVADLLPLLRPICSIVSAAVPEIETAK